MTRAGGTDAPADPAPPKARVRLTAGRGVRVTGDDDVGPVQGFRSIAGLGRTKVAEDDFPAFYRAHLTTIYRFLRSRTPTPQDAEDLVQQVFFKAYRSRSGFRGDEAARVAWLFRIARNETT